MTNCSYFLIPDGDARLVGGKADLSEGILEVFYQGEWGTVCDDEFNQQSAKTACNQMGFEYVFAKLSTYNMLTFNLDIIPGQTMLTWCHNSLKIVSMRLQVTGVLFCSMMSLASALAQS